MQAMIRDNGDAAKFGIALRSMAKGGKFSGPNDNANADAKKAVEGVAVGAVIKALDTLTIAIRNTIDAGLKEVMKININDASVASEKSGSSVQNQ
ncbi:Borrelia lipoprotein-containing protein (plasmid) [Borrelia crocidurae str. Achema]|uniref:Variable large protein n=1 Tax=Borrelia crocidurae (strain Achema) TaxID=1155096 RepID=I0FEL6_BORCA|nr:Borrelia lipoprotein-containing protein [Borrelia crocidurae str. Achema]